MKMHFLSSVAFALVVTGSAMHPELNVRMMLLVPSLVLFYATVLFFGMEYEKDRSLSWKKHEERLIEETYLKFFMKEKQKN